MTLGSFGPGWLARLVSLVTLVSWGCSADRLTIPTDPPARTRGVSGRVSPLIGEWKTHPDLGIDVVQTDSTWRFDRVGRCRFAERTRDGDSTFRVSSRECRYVDRDLAVEVTFDAGGPT